MSWRWRPGFFAVRSDLEVEDGKETADGRKIDSSILSQGDRDLWFEERASSNSLLVEDRHRGSARRPEDRSSFLKTLFERAFTPSRLQEVLMKIFSVIRRTLRTRWFPRLRRDGDSQRGGEGSERGFVMITPSDVGRDSFSNTIFRLPEDQRAESPLGVVETGVLGRRPRGSASRFLTGKRATVYTSESKGRIVGYRVPLGAVSDVALVPTLTRAALRTVEMSNRLPIRPSVGDVRCNVRVSRSPASVILVLDLSQSMTFHLPAIHRAVASLHERAYRYRDRVGLIALQGGRAKVVLHPTANINVVTRKIRRLASGGKTALALGLVKASRIASLERRRSRESLPVVVLFSDGLTTTALPSRLSSSSREMIKSPAQADVVAAARGLARRDVPVIIVNPIHLEEWTHEGMLSPTGLLVWVAKITGGRYFGFETGVFRSTLTPERAVEVVDSALGDILTR